MILAVHCERCGKTVAIHRGELIDLPVSMKLYELIANADDTHKCENGTIQPKLNRPA